MTIAMNSIISLADANQDFSRVAQIAETEGRVVIYEDNRPKYMLVDLEHVPIRDLTDDEKIDVAAARILNRYRSAFEELAK